MDISVESSSSVPPIKSSVRLAWWKHIYWRQQLSAYLFLLPSLIVFCLFAWIPIIRTIIFSFQKVSFNGESTWIGFDNIHRMLIDPAFVQAWSNSFAYVSLSITIGYVLPIVVAIMVNEMHFMRGFFRLVYFLPTVIPITVSLIIWRQIYNPDNGFLNAFLALMKAPAQLWLQDPHLIKGSLIVIATWAAFGTTVLIYIAALQDIPTEYYEAAEISGANPIQRILYITLPLLYPTMVLTFVLQIIFVVQIFTEPFLLAPGAQAATTPVLEIYRRAFHEGDFGGASAWSLSLIVILGIFSAVYQRLTYKIHS